MRRHQRTISTWAILAVLACSFLSTGCEPLNWFGNNLSLNFVVPLGLGGTPGVFNPFGIVQALVNAALGADESSNSAYENPAAAPTDTTTYDPAVNVVLD